MDCEHKLKPIANQTAEGYLVRVAFRVSLSASGGSAYRRLALEKQKRPQLYQLFYLGTRE